MYYEFMQNILVDCHKLILPNSETAQNLSTVTND